jgi:hypothetical protein
MVPPRKSNARPTANYKIMTRSRLVLIHEALASNDPLPLGAKHRLAIFVDDPQHVQEGVDPAARPRRRVGLAVLVTVVVEH